MSDMKFFKLKLSIVHMEISTILNVEKLPAYKKEIKLFQLRAADTDYLMDPIPNCTFIIVDSPFLSQAMRLVQIRFILAAAKSNKW